MIINSVETKKAENIQKETPANVGSKKLGSSEKQESREKIGKAKEVLLSQSVPAIVEAVKAAVIIEVAKKVVEVVVKEIKTTPAPTTTVYPAAGDGLK